MLVVLQKSLFSSESLTSKHQARHCGPFIQFCLSSWTVGSAFDGSSFSQMAASVGFKKFIRKRWNESTSESGGCVCAAFHEKKNKMFKRSRCIVWKSTPKISPKPPYQWSITCGPLHQCINNTTHLLLYEALDPSLLKDRSFFLQFIIGFFVSSSVDSWREKED